MTTSQQTSNSLAMEIRGNSWRGRAGSEGFKVPLQRNAQGHITGESKDAVIHAINQLTDTASQKPSDIICAISSGGLLLRTMELPPTSDDALNSLVELQIEKEWPLSPEVLAWGFQKIKTPSSTDSENPTSPIEIAIVAVKRTVFQQYIEILNACGFHQATWLASASIGMLIDEIKHLKNAWLIDINDQGSQLTYHEWGLPTLIKQFPSGSDQLKTASQLADQKITESAPTEVEHSTDNSSSSTHSNTIKDWATPIFDQITSQGPPPSIVLSGEEACLEKIQPLIQETFPGIPIQSYPIHKGPGISLITHLLTNNSLRTSCQNMIHLETQQELEMAPAMDKAPFIRWGILLAALVLAIFLARRIEPSLKTGKLETQLIEFREQKKLLPEIDRELSFLEHIQNKSLPYMDLIGLLAEHAPRGFQLESLDMGSDRRIQVRGLLSGAHPEDLRAKLLATEWFEQVVLDEQTPDRNGRKITIRITLLVKEYLKRPKVNLAMLGIEPEQDEDKEKKGSN